MIFDVAVVRDNGDTWIVDYITKNEFMHSDIGEKYVRISSVTADEIRKAKEKGYPVLIPKGIPTEVTPGEIIIQKANDLACEKGKASYAVYSIINETLETLSIVDVYAYTSIWAKFLERGIFITDENVDKVKELFTVHKDAIKDRDDAYVDIIMKGSEEDLEDLQQLVDTKDKLKRVYDLMKRINKTIKNIESATTIEEVQDIKNTFMHTFNFPSA